MSCRGLLTGVLPPPHAALAMAGRHITRATGILVGLALTVGVGCLPAGQPTSSLTASPSPIVAIDCGGLDTILCGEVRDAILADPRGQAASEVTLKALDLSDSDVLGAFEKTLLGRLFGEPLVFATSADVLLTDGTEVAGLVGRHREGEALVVLLSPQPNLSGCVHGDAARAEFRQGQAAVQLSTGQTIALSRLDSTAIGASFDPNCPAGAQAAWADASGGWLLTVMANVEPFDPDTGQRAFVTLEWYSGQEPPLFADASTCPLTITQIDAAGLVGHLECHDLRWLSDYDAQARPDLATPLPQFPPFDATISFEARP